MITLYRQKGDPKADEIEDAFDELVINYDVVELEEGRETYIRDDDETLRTDQEIHDWLVELRKQLKQERSVTADACYIDPETGEFC